MKMFAQLIVTLTLLSSNLAYAEFSCKFKTSRGHGQVILVKNMNIEGKIFPFGHHVGNEKWENPFYFRHLCQKIAKTLNQVDDIRFSRVWVFSHCQSYNDIEKRIFTYRLRGRTLKFRTLVPFPPAVKNRVGSTNRCDSSY